MSKKKLLKSFFALIICMTIVENCIPVSAASRSNTYMTTSCVKNNAKMTVKNDFTVDSIYAKMRVYWVWMVDGTLHNTEYDKTTNRTRSCSLNQNYNTLSVIKSVYFEGKIDGSNAGSWMLDV